MGRQPQMSVEKLPFGAAVKLPEPVNITLDTEPLKEFAD